MNSFWDGFEKRAIDSGEVAIPLGKHWDNYYTAEWGGVPVEASHYLNKHRKDLAKEWGENMTPYLSTPAGTPPPKPTFLDKAKKGLGGAAVGAGYGGLIGLLGGRKGALIGAAVGAPLAGYLGYKMPGQNHEGAINSLNERKAFQAMDKKTKKKYLDSIGHQAVDNELSYYKKHG